jgi:hypothetical protein
MYQFIIFQKRLNATKKIWSLSKPLSCQWFSGKEHQTLLSSEHLEAKISPPPAHAQPFITALAPSPVAGGGECRFIRLVRIGRNHCGNGCLPSLGGRSSTTMEVPVPNLL